MALADNGPAPYAPTHAIIAFLDHVRDKGIPEEINRAFMVRLVSRSYAGRTLRALEQLDLVEDGKATSTLQKLRVEPSDKLQEKLREWYHEAYKTVLTFCSPSDNIDTITDQFRPFEPPGTRDRMVKLFLGLAEYVGLIEEVPRRPRVAKPSSKQKSSTEPPSQKHNAGNGGGSQAGPAKERYVTLLLALAEEADGKPDDDLLDRIERVLDVIPSKEAS